MAINLWDLGLGMKELQSCDKWGDGLIPGMASDMAVISLHPLSTEVGESLVGVGLK